MHQGKLISENHSYTDQRFFEDLTVRIPGGLIELRDDRISRKWKVQIDTFLLSKVPVTQELYLIVMGENPSDFLGSLFPVHNVSWIDALVFCNNLSEMAGFTPYYEMLEATDMIKEAPLADGFRLPNEAEWQYACQAGSKDVRYGEISEVAWYRGNSGGRPQEVGTKKPNDWGLFDMLGNVWEWCSDIYDENEYGPYRIFRGGGWCDDERSVMATNRRRSHPSSFKIDDLGFRIARSQIIPLPI